MEKNLLKKVLYTGVGLISTTSENIQKNIDELVKKGSLTEDEGKKVVTDFVETTEVKREEFQARMTEVVTNVLEKLKLPSIEEFKSLTNRLTKLEKSGKATVKETATNAKKKSAKVTVKKTTTLEKSAKATVKKTTTNTKKKSAKAKKDDLKMIEGIGAKIAEHLTNGGVVTYADLAAAPISKLEGILEAAGPRYRMHNPATWSQQADLAANGKWDELKKLQDELDGGKPKK